MAARAETPRQEIPRPTGALPGAPAPWSELPEAGRRGITLDEVRRALGAVSPAPQGNVTGPQGDVAGPQGDVAGPQGDVAGPQRGFAGPQRGFAGGQGEGPGPAGTRVTPAELPEGAGSGPAAVVCLLFEHAGEANVVLTRRSAHLRSHSGEVSFPGGRLQPGEAPLQAALREANEEIGVEPSAVEVIGHLTPLTTVRSPALVHCFVAHFQGSAPESLAFAFNPGEVEKVFWVSLAQLASDGVYHEELWPVFERPGRPASGTTSYGSGSYRAIPFFRLEEDIVWGATGRLLTELLGAVLARRAGLAGQGWRDERRSGRSGGYLGGT